MEVKNITNYRPDIDGIRAVSVMMAIFFHFFPSVFISGFIGVDIFFVISGFLISRIILKSIKSENFSYIEFYKRRIKRIFPALITVLISCLVVGWFTLFSNEYLSLGKHVAGGAGFISNILYFFERGYFDVSSYYKPLLHLWSLGVEEQFYIFWPILLVLFSKKNRKTIIMMIILFIISFSYNLYLGIENSAASFFLPFTRFWEFLGGAILAYINIYNGGILNILSDKFKINLSTIKSKFILETLSFFGAILIIISLFIINSANFYKGYVIILILGVFSVIASGQDSFINKKILSNKILVFIGLISYPLYLWHWPLLSLTRTIQGNYPSIEMRFLLILISFILAWATYRFIEKPIRYSENKKTPSILLIIMLFIGLSGYLIYTNKGFNFRFPEQENIIKTYSDDPYNASDKISKNNINKECSDIYKLKIYLLDCYSAGNSDNKIFVIGDSHAKAIWRAYQKSLTDRGYTVTSLGVGGCSFLSQNLKVKHNIVCNKSLKQVIDFVNSQKPELIIISKNYLNADINIFTKSMNEEISYLPENTRIIWILQTPYFNLHQFDCLRTKKCDPNYLRFSTLKINKKLIKYNIIINDLKIKYPQIITLDPISVLCDSNTCPVILDNKFLYKDDYFHMSIFGSNILSEKLPIAQFFPNLKK